MAKWWHSAAHFIRRHVMHGSVKITYSRMQIIMMRIVIESAFSGCDAQGLSSNNMKYKPPIQRNIQVNIITSSIKFRFVGIDAICE